ncbi:unnamed protein product [Symbiodinium natans]|uniref:Uncharacterized protein n=1 Tax=Symbiodinium natans TaxID=878477 RepID=A0A812RP26_9DINO|nr:unnamed protein product [Symbiodinium natans]
MRLSYPSTLTILFCFGPRAWSLRQPVAHQASFVPQIGAVPASAFLDLEDGDVDKAHAGLWKALQSAKIKYETVSFDSPLPTDLEVTANGRALPWDSPARPGRVNPVRLLLAVRGERFKQVVSKGGKIQLYLKSATGYLDRSETIPPCMGAGISDCVEGGFAAAYFQVPENSHLTVQLKVSLAGEDDISHDWDIETADAGSGDAQARILFLSQNHTEYEKKWLSSEMGRRQFAYANEQEKFSAKELTIFDLDSSAFKPDLERNGFEMDSSGILKAALDDLMFNMEREDVQQDFTTTVVITSNESCYINSTEDLLNISQHLDGDNLTAGSCNKNIFYDYKSDYFNPKFGGGERFLGVYKCDANFSASEINCSDEPVNLSTDLLPPLMIKYQSAPRTRDTNTSRAAAMHTGAALALMAEEQRAEIWKQLSGEPVVVGSTTYRTVGDIDDLVETMETAIRLSEILVQSMEKAAEDWWRSKTGAETKAACFSMNFRHTRKGMKGLPIAHVDATSVHEWFKPDGAFPASALKGFENKLGMNVSEALKHTVVTFNEWVNAGADPIVELPLTILDTASLDDKDLETAWIQVSLDSMSLRYSPSQRWYYKELKRGEGYRFITSPHEGPGGTRYTGTPHSAFRFIRKENMTADRPRQSYEFRCLVLDPNWTSPNSTVSGLAVEPTDDKEIVKEAASAIMAGIMASPQAVMESLVDTEDFKADE